jgi:hypothetical protein
MEYQSGAVSPVGSIQEGWQIIKDDYWTFFGMTLVAMIIILVAAMILGGINSLLTAGISSIFGVGARSAGDAAAFSAALVPQLISMIISFFTGIVVGTLSGVLFCGIYTALANKTTRGTSDFGDLFSGFQKIVSCMIVATVLSVVQFVISAVTLVIGGMLGVSVLSAGILSKDGSFNPAIFGGIFVGVLLIVILNVVVNLIVSVLTSFAYPLIADRNLSGGEALTLSARAGFANIGGLILLMILLALMAFGGVLVCFVGVLFVAPIMSASLFAAYQRVFGRKSGQYQSTPPPPPIFNNQPGY